MECFRGGIAQEWLITNEATYRWLDAHVGYDQLQMGGQGGIIANVMAVCGIRNVLVHAASLPAEQSSLFVDRANLLSASSEGRLRPVRSVARPEDTPLIHWILEFDKGDVVTVGGERITCPKSNRFIATWDPLNFTLCIDPHFVAAVDAHQGRLDACMLSGYQMLTEDLSTGETALQRIVESKRIVDRWREGNPDLIVHFEYASTQDEAVRLQLFREMSGWADSMGLNEQELIAVLEVTGQAELAEACRRTMGAVALYEGLRWVFDNCAIPRIQLHFFGLYLTLQKKGHRHTPAQTRNGMALAATIAAAKAGTGSIEVEENLLWAEGRDDRRGGREGAHGPGRTPGRSRARRAGHPRGGGLRCDRPADDHHRRSGHARGHGGYDQFAVAGGGALTRRPIMRSIITALCLVLVTAHGFADTAGTQAPEEGERMAKVTGIGGVFFLSKGEGKDLSAWYEQHLGLTMEAFGAAVLEWKNDTAEDGGATVWHVADHDSQWFSPSGSSFMINYRVDDLELMIEQLTAAGVEILQGPEYHENGAFAWIMDPEGNKIELWEPKIWDDKNKR